MEIIKSDSEKMILTNGGVFVVGVLFGAIFAAISGSMIFFIKYGTSVLELNCQRTAEAVATRTVNCIVKEYRFWGLIPYPEQKIDHIRSAQITSETYIDNEGITRRTANRVTLETVNENRIPLNMIGVVFNLDRFVNKFNSFVAGDQTSNSPNNFMFIYDMRRNLLLPFGVLFAGAFLRIGIFISTMCIIHDGIEEQIILDKSKQSLTWKLPNSFGPIQYQLSHIRGVEIHTAKIRNRKNVFQVYLSVESTGLILIKEDCEDYEDYPVEKESINLQAKQLAEFLGVPVERRSL